MRCGRLAALRSVPTATQNTSVNKHNGRGSGSEFTNLQSSARTGGSGSLPGGSGIREYVRVCVVGGGEVWLA